MSQKKKHDPVYSVLQDPILDAVAVEKETLKLQMNCCKQ
jgi:hypothetical protein